MSVVELLVSVKVVIACPDPALRDVAPEIAAVQV